MQGALNNTHTKRVQRNWKELDYSGLRIFGMYGEGLNLKYGNAGLLNLKRFTDGHKLSQNVDRSE